MHEQFAVRLVDALSLADVELTVIEVLEEFRGRYDRIGYVSGVITSDGSEHITENIERLHAYADDLRKKYPFPVFSPTDIFTDEVYGRIDAHKLSSAEFVRFFRTILGAGHVTDMFMTPGWERSMGARDEYEAAKALGIEIHYV